MAKFKGKHTGTVFTGEYKAGGFFVQVTFDYGEYKTNSVKFDTKEQADNECHFFNMQYGFPISRMEEPV